MKEKYFKPVGFYGFKRLWVFLIAQVIILIVFAFSGIAFPRLNFLPVGVIVILTVGLIFVPLLVMVYYNEAIGFAVSFQFLDQSMRWGLPARYASHWRSLNTSEMKSFEICARKVKILLKSGKKRVLPSFYTRQGVKYQLFIEDCEASHGYRFKLRAIP